ncbi:MAG: hypothetical protein JST89_24185 [Cyanobacteria bacterium SZAS-4]|nr:hypothetical protein [Cyanobacteria bacterium SZAS-4]
MNQIQSLLEKFREITAKEEMCQFIQAAQPQAVSFRGSLQDRLPVQMCTTVTVNILTDLCVGPPPLTDGGMIR